jgi:hypothetical protein
MLIDFLDDEKFKNRILIIGGERIVGGFVAFVSSMRWDCPYETEPLTNAEKREIVDKIANYNFDSDCRIVFEGEV